MQFIQYIKKPSIIFFNVIYLPQNIELNEFNCNELLTVSLVKSD